MSRSTLRLLGSRDALQLKKAMTFTCQKLVFLSTITISYLIRNTAATRHAIRQSNYNVLFACKLSRIKP